ncbi:hypothetical protein CSUI_003845 [Cystoisospora suis]|uniref:Uncharacterized protein n=1 Tax=Cystoisospora suis TaxID=483139 RepID=A0A2C6L3B1_9APIC|nr:hypothetical protein CSUI_003845 [Cystoisospora suis]
MAAQYIMMPEMRQSLYTLGSKSMELLRGLPTDDVQLESYHDPETCTVVFDTLNDGTHFGLMDADEIKITYSHTEHQGTLDYIESRREAIEVLKQKQRHIQRFNIPKGCLADESSTWVAYCRRESPPCYAGRIDVQLSRGPVNEKPVPLTLLPYETFAEQMVEKDGIGFYDVDDIFEAETPLYRLTWDPDKCIVHYRYMTNDQNETAVYWLRTRQAFRIDVKDLDGKFVRKMSAMTSECGGRSPEQFSVTSKELTDGTIKVLFRAERLAEPETHKDRFELKKLPPHVPTHDWNPESSEAFDFLDLFPDVEALSLDLLVKD